MDVTLKVFVSHSHRDRAGGSTRAIHDRLSKIRGIEVLADWKAIEVGESITKAVASMIRTADLVVVNYTANAVTAQGVQHELALANDRKGRIVLLVSPGVTEAELPHFLKDERYLRYTVAIDEALDELEEYLQRKVHELRHPLPYLGWDLRRRDSLTAWLPGLVVANVGFVTWYLLNKFLDVAFFSDGSSLFELPWPAIWAVAGGWSIPVAVVISLRVRQGVLCPPAVAWILPTCLFLLAFTSAATVFHLSGTDEALARASWHPRVSATFSTATWSMVLGGVTLGLLALFPCAGRFRPVPVYVLWGVGLTLVSTLACLALYFAVLPPTDLHRGAAAVVGLRSGLFVALHLSAVRSPRQSQRAQGRR